MLGLRPGRGADIDAAMQESVLAWARRERTMTHAACLVVIFNHAYPDNIPTLRRLYGRRFSRIVFLLPNRRVSDPACFTAYRGSYAFHGLVADAREFLLAQDADTYVFAADDLVLNPALADDTVADSLRLGEHDGFAPEFKLLAGRRHVDAAGRLGQESPGRDWPWTRRVLSRLDSRHPMLGSGVEGYLAELPDRETALRKFRQYGEPLLSLEMPPGLRRGVRRLLSWLDRPTVHTLPLPLAYGISDLFAVRRSRLDRLAHYLGVLAALDLFVEVAVPTALILATERVITAGQVGWQFSWAPSSWNSVEYTFRSLPDLEARYPTSQLFVHPVKLSQLAS
jgi:hypothetical protein